MKKSIKELTGFSMGATDGEIGKVSDFYFDDNSWTIRYLVVETGSWLSGRKVLISPQSLLSVDPDEKVFPVNLTKDQIKHSPDIDTDKPVSKQEELKLFSHYPWRSYWGGGLWGGGIGTTGMVMPEPSSVEEEISGEHIKEGDISGDHHLRSCHDMLDYTIKANDGTIGSVEDFLVDENTWKIDFMVADTGSWFSGKKVILSPALIKKITWDNSEVVVNASEQQVKTSKEYRDDEPVDSETGGQIYSYN